MTKGEIAHMIDLLHHLLWVINPWLIDSEQGSYQNSFVIIIFQLFAHMINLQQTTLKSTRQQYRKFLLMQEELLHRVENIMAKGEIAKDEQFLLL